MEVLEAVERVNERQKELLFHKLQRELGEDLRGKRVALWGLAFKPETDDMREAPALRLIDRLIEAGAEVVVYDPIAMDECRRRVGDRVKYGTNIYDTVEGADALMLVTEWKQFRMPEWRKVKELMRSLVVIDGRNIYDPVEIENLGSNYACIGRKSKHH